MAEITRVGFELEGLSDPVVRRFEAHERLASPYELTVELLDVDAAFDVAGALGKHVTLTVEQEALTARCFSGIVWGVRGTDGERGPERDTVLELAVRPALSLLGLGQRSRIFQKKTVPEILDEVLAEGLAPHGRGHEARLGRSYPAREHCVQYQESDLDFAARLMAEEGIFYSFDFPEGRAELLVLHDANATLAALPDAEIPFSPEAEGRVERGPRMTHFVSRRGLRTSAITLLDWDWTGPRVVEASREGEAVHPALPSYEHGHGRTLTLAGYDEGAARYQSDDATEQARLRLEAKNARRDEAVGRAAMAQLTAGARFTLVGHPGALDGDYVLVEVAHRQREEDGGARRGYVVDLTCIPADVPFRMPPRKKPVIHSVQTATVVGPAGEEIHTDAHGRVVVQFHWDREGASDDKSSCWIRVRQAWAGDGWGFLFIPRIGMEVVVSFLGGDPDRPLVTGCVYNGDNPPPYALPDERTKSTIKTNSSKGGGGFNEYRFEDKSGSEQIYIHAQKDFDEVVEACHTTTVGGNQTNEVQGNQTQDIGDWQKETVDVDQKMTVVQKRTVSVGGSFTEDIDRGETRTVTGGSKEEITAGESRIVVGPMTETVTGGETRTVKGGLVEGVIGTFTRNVTGGDAVLKADGAFTKTVTGALTVTTPGQMKFDAKSGVIIDAGGPVTATGGPFVEYITTTETVITKIEVKYGVMKLNLYGAKAGSTNVGVALVKSSTSATVAKAEAYAAKIDLGGAKVDITGAKMEVVGLFAGCGADSKKNKAFWFK